MSVCGSSPSTKAALQCVAPTGPFCTHFPLIPTSLQAGLTARAEGPRTEIRRAGRAPSTLATDPVYRRKALLSKPGRKTKQCPAAQTQNGPRESAISRFRPVSGVSTELSGTDSAQRNQRVSRNDEANSLFIPKIYCEPCGGAGFRQLVSDLGTWRLR